MKWMKVCISPLSFCIIVVTGTFILFTSMAFRTPSVQAGSEPVTVFSNPASIAPADRTSNGAGTNPGIPPANYPSGIVVTGLTGTVTKITVTFSITSTFPDDFDILLVGPTGARSLVISDAGGSGDHTNVSYTFDQAAAAAFPDTGTAVIPTGTYRPANYIGLATPEPGGQDNFPTPGPGLMAYTADFNVFNGTNPNGTWNLFVVDDQQIDTMSLPGGWSIDITTGAGGGDAPMDFNGDGRSDYVVVRNVGGGSGGQVRWFVNYSSGGGTLAYDWGISTDFFVSQDFDGDGKDDIAVYRPTSAPNSFFYILNSSNGTVRIENLGATGDDPTVVDDYDGDGKADVAVYRGGASAGMQSFWYYRGTLNNPGGNITFVPWGLNGDFPMPGDRDGNGSADFTIQRNNGSGSGAFWTRLSTGATMPVTVFGNSSDLILPGDYDGDGKTDLAVARGAGGQISWHWLRSSDGVIVGPIIWGLSATDFPAQGDFDGDGRVEPAIWRPNADPNNCFFYSRNSTNGGLTTFELGQQGDYPVGNYNSH